VSPVAGDDMLARAGTKSEGDCSYGSDDSDASYVSSDGVMNEDLGVCHDSLGYEKRFELRQSKRMQRHI
jgi:hypothetical protein